MPMAPVARAIEEMVAYAPPAPAPGSQMELEVRIGKLRPGSTHFVPGVTRESFSAITELLRSNEGWEEFRHIKQTDYYKSVRGSSVRLSLDDNTGAETMIRKRKLAQRTFSMEGCAYDVRVSMSAEEDPGVTMEEFGDECQDSREKERVSYRHRNKYGMTWSFDATVVKPGPEEHKDPDEDAGAIIYEMELEVPWDHQHKKYMAQSSALKVLDVLRAGDPFMSVKELAVSEV